MPRPFPFTSSAVRRSQRPFCQTNCVIVTSLFRLHFWLYNFLSSAVFCMGNFSL